MKLIAVICVTLLLIMTSETQTCTPIQECDLTINENCFAHVNDNLNWYQAEDCCVAWGGHLASIHSYDDNILLNSIRNQERWTWIGLSDIANDSVYVWTDATPFDYENFATNEPNHLDGESCIHFFSTYFGVLTWNDYHCSNTSEDTLLNETILTSYICQKRQFTSVCVNKVISDVNDTRGICYEESLTTDMLDWNAAALNCSNTNRRLAGILNEEMSNEIERVTQDTDEYWIGLSRSNSNSEFMWSDGSSLSSTRWSSGHPMNGLNCVSVRGDRTEWYSRNCSEVKPYVCETDVCVSWIVRNGICYKKFDDTINADNAESLCEAECAYLAEIPNIYVDNIITEMVEDRNVREYWTGLRTNSTHYYWRIGDFPLGEESPLHEDRCGSVDDNDGNRWSIRGCGIIGRVICMIGPLTNEFPIERCENSSNDTLVYEDSCYTRIRVHERNLDRATLTCTDYYNGTLYTLDNTTVNSELRDKFGNDIAIVDPEEYSKFTPQDGYFNLYTTYNQIGYPNNPDCVTIDSMGMLSGSSNCPSDDHDYICKRAKTTTTPTPPTISPPNHSNYSYSYPCENNVIDNIDYIGGICYTAFSSDIVNWSTADMKCGEDGTSRLALALADTMSNEIERVTQDTDEYWIGLSRSNSNSEFMWSDGSSLSYTRWSSGHPINGLNCVSVKGGSTEWYSRNCSEVKPYVCETDVCGDWTVRNGICYKKFDSNTTWTDSVELCKNESAFLAEIPNIYINDRIAGLIPYTEECYIGLYEDITGISWRIGKFPVTEPNSTSVATSTDIRYGTMHGSGRWSIGNEDTNRCVVCMRGNPTPEKFDNYQCNSVTDNVVKDTVNDGSCYRRLGATPSNLDIITYRCQNFVNGELYTFDNLDLNEQLFQRFNTDTFNIQSRNQYSGYIPPENSFNLLATIEKYNFSEYYCEIVSRDSVINPYTAQAGETCEDSSVIFFCKTDYIPFFYISNQITFNETLYQLIAHNKDYDQAKSDCSNQKGNNNENGRLMEILNQQQQQVLLDLTSTDNSYVDEYYWIGLTYYGSSHVWVSGVVANYIQNITIQTDTVSYCVAVDREGNWLGLNCSDKYSYICQKPNVIFTTTTTTNMVPTETPDLICLKNSTTPICVTLRNSTYDPSIEMNPLIERENFLESLNDEIIIEAGQTARVLNEDLGADILVTSVDSNINTTLSLNDVILEINDQSFENDSTVTCAVYRDSSEFISPAILVTPIVTIIASETLIGEFTIIFPVNDPSDGGTLICSSYTDSSTWISHGIITNKMENTIACTTNHLTTFAVAQIITITSNDTINCSNPDSRNNSFCNTIEDLSTLSQSENSSAVQSLQYVDDYLADFITQFNITTGITLEIVQPQTVLVIIGLRQDSKTSVAVGENVVTANPDSFPADTVLVVLSITFNDTKEFTNDSVRIVSDIITIQASNDLNGTLTIQFIIRNELKMDISNAIQYCAFLQSDGTWSDDGITTTIINNRVECITSHLSLFTLLSSTSICDVAVGEINKTLLQTSYTLLSISLLFLLASIITFSVSWKNVFRIDINVMNFNHTIALFLAILVSIFGTELFSKHPIVCHILAFLWHFLWTNVFLSSLSISILVFYSIWIVGIKHLARKLCPFLIPIAWSFSLVWALIWLAYGITSDKYIVKTSNENCQESCILSTQSRLVYALIVPVMVILMVNILILFLNLFRIRQVFKRNDKSETELVRLRKVAFGGLLLVPSLGLPFLLSVPLTFSHLFTNQIPVYLFFQWTSLIATTTIGIMHFFLVTYQTPEVKLLPSCIRSNRQSLTSETSLPSSSKISQQKPEPLKFNIVRKNPEVDGSVIENEHAESKM